MKIIVILFCVAMSDGLKLSASASRHKSENSTRWGGVHVACVGWKKTGTTTMHEVYSILGMIPVGGVNRCKSPACMRQFAAVEDAYACCNQGLIATMKQQYSAEKVKFVLTERSSNSWKASIDSWVQKPGKGKKFEDAYGKLMGAKYGSPAFYQKYEAHNQFIKNLFRDEPERLLVLNLERDDPIENMAKFCKFVGISVQQNPACNRPIPHANAHPHFGKILNADEWLHIDENDDELDDFDAELATRDWREWYAENPNALLLDEAMHYK